MVGVAVGTATVRSSSVGGEAVGITAVELGSAVGVIGSVGAIVGNITGTGVGDNGDIVTVF